MNEDCPMDGVLSYVLDDQPRRSDRQAFVLLLLFYAVVSLFVLAR